MTQFIDVMYSRFKAEVGSYASLRRQMEETKEEKKKIERRMELLRQLLAVDSVLADKAR